MTLIYTRALLSIEKISSSYSSSSQNLKVSSSDDDNTATKKALDGRSHGNVENDDGDEGDADVVNESCDEDNSDDNYNERKQS